MLRCPACARPLDETGKQIPAGVQCTVCHHLWQIEGDQVLALNAGHPLLTDNPAPVVTLPATPPTLAGVMTAAKASCFLEEEVG